MASNNLFLQLKCFSWIFIDLFGTIALILLFFNSLIVFLCVLVVLWLTTKYYYIQINAFLAFLPFLKIFGTFQLKNLTIMLICESPFGNACEISLLYCIKKVDSSGKLCFKGCNNNCVLLPLSMWEPACLYLGVIQSV